MLVKLPIYGFVVMILAKVAVIQKVQYFHRLQNSPSFSLPTSERRARSDWCDARPRGTGTFLQSRAATHHTSRVVRWLGEKKGDYREFCMGRPCWMTWQLLLLPQALQKVELEATFLNVCGNDFIDFSIVVQCNIPSAVCLAMLCSISQSASLFRSSSTAVSQVAGNPIAQCKTPVRATAMLHF